MTVQLEIPEARPTQKRRILALLRMAGPAGVCISNVPTELAYTARNRVSELRREGFEIEGSPCRVHNHHSAVSRYVLVKEPA